MNVTFALNDLWREVFGSPTQRPRPIGYPLGEPEVRDLEVAVPIQKEVLRLEVSVDDGEGVEVVQRGDDLGRVEERGVGVEATGGAEVREELAAAHVGEQHVKEVRVFVVPNEVDEERVVDLLENVLLVLDVLDLLEPDDIAHGEDLERVEVLVGAMPAQVHSGERPRTDRLEHLQFIDGERSRALGRLWIRWRWRFSGGRALTRSPGG